MRLAAEQYAAHAEATVWFDGLDSDHPTPLAPPPVNRDCPTPVVPADAAPPSGEVDAEFVALWSIAQKLPPPPLAPSGLHRAARRARRNGRGLAS